MSKDDFTYNSLLVDTVRKHPCLYDCNLAEYSNKKLTKEAWENVAKEMNDSVASCKEKWRNLRIVFSRHVLKSLHRNSSKVSYYLYEQMEFLKPFIRMRVSGALQPYTEAVEESTESLTSDNDAIEIKREIIYTSSNVTENHLERDFLEPCKTRPINTNETDNFESVECSERHTENPKKRAKCSYHADLSNTNLEKERRLSYRAQFLQSLEPDVEEMTSVEFRKFRKEVTKLIDDLLDSSSSKSLYINV